MCCLNTGFSHFLFEFCVNCLNTSICDFSPTKKKGDLNNKVLLYVYIVRIQAHEFYIVKHFVEYTHNTHTHTHAHILTHTHSLSLPLSLSHTHTHTHTHSLSLSQTHTCKKSFQSGLIMHFPGNTLRQQKINKLW